jgi:YidC/Oxa1 family membrane protein insertase
MTPSVSEEAEPVPTVLSRIRPWLLPAILLVSVALLLVACQPLGATVSSSASVAASPGVSASASAVASATASATATINPNSIPLHPANPTDPIQALSWLFTPVFQGLFLLLVFFQQLTGDMAIAIIIVTLVVRAIVIPLYRKQIVSQRRMQLLQPELKEIQKRFKGDRAKMQTAQAEFYKERGVNPASGCLPLVLQFALLLPMYSVFSNGLQNVDPNGMLRIFGLQIIHLTCPDGNLTNVAQAIQPCINSVVFGVDLSRPSVLFTLPVIGIGISVLAIASALFQLVQSRMTLPPASQASDDAGSKAQRQTMLFIPLISIFYGGFLPAGLFVYWIVSTVFSVVQQYLIIGWGGMFPILGWQPAWAEGHTPRFPVAIPAPDPTKRAPDSVLTTKDERAAHAASTVRPRERSGRQGRRGRRR